MVTSNPGVRVYVKDGYNFPANSAPYAERIAIIAKHGETPASDIADRLYTPIAYTNPNDVADAYGIDSDAYVAFLQVHGAGGANIFVIATPNDAATVPAAMTDTHSPDEYEVYMALEHVDIAQPDMIVIMGYEVNKTYKPGATATDRVSKVAKMVVDKCHEFAADGFPAFAVTHPSVPTGTDVITSAVTISDYLDKLLTTEPVGYVTMADVIASLGTDTDGEDLGKYFTYVVGEVEMLDGPSVFKPAVGAAAGSVYVNGLGSGITMRKIARVKNIRYNFSKSMRTLLLDNNAIPVALDNRGYAVTVDGVTCAAQDENDNDSLFERLSTVRVAFEVIKSSRRIVEQSIGLPASTETFNSLQTMLASYYGTLKNKGLVSDISFSFDYLASEYKVVIAINITPTGDLRNVDLVVGVSMR